MFSANIASIHHIVIRNKFWMNSSSTTDTNKTSNYIFNYH